MTDLPFIDEHAVVVDASPAHAWLGLADVMTGGLGTSLAARALGCRDTVARGAPLERGSTVPGFRVALAEPVAELVLAGEHRFSRYALTFRIDALEPQRSQVRAESRAAFPVVRGRAYRTLVVGSHGHVLAVGRLLRTIRLRAERHERRATTVP